MPRGDRWWSEPPLWAWIVMVASALVLVVLTPLALQRTAVPDTGASDTTVQPADPDDRSKSADATDSPSAAPAPDGAILRDHFADDTGQWALTADTGQAWTLVGNSDLQLEDLGLTLEDPGVGYVMTDVGDVPTRMGVSVLFEPGEPGGLVTLFVSGGPGFNLADVGLQYAFDAVGWTVQVRQGGEAPLPRVAAGRFDPPLAADGVTIHDAEVAIDGDTLTITGPDGKVVTAADRRIGENQSGMVGWGVFRPEDGQARPVISSVWATVS